MPSIPPCGRTFWSDPVPRLPVPCRGSSIRSARKTTCDPSPGTVSPSPAPAYIFQQRSGNAAAAPVGLRIDGADIRGEVLPVMKIILNHAEATDDPVSFQGDLPPRNDASPCQARLHALPVGLQGNSLFFMKPPGSRFLQTGPFPQRDNFIFHPNILRLLCVIFPSLPPGCRRGTPARGNGRSNRSGGPARSAPRTRTAG